MEPSRCPQCGSDAFVTVLSEDEANGKQLRRYCRECQKRGAELARKRICGSCHNPDLSGREQMPRLAGQREAYLLKSFKEYQAGQRVGTQAAMAEAVRGLSDSELADLAYHLAHFRP